MMKVLIKSSLFIAIAAGVLLVGLSPAQALEVKLSGQINRALMWADNGNNDELFHVDNDNSSTRFRLVGSEKVSDWIEVGVVWESQFESNSSSSVDIGQDSDGTSSFTERKLEAWFGSRYGKLWIGQGDGAANGTSEVDLSGTSVIMYSGVNDTGGGINFRRNDDSVVARISDTRSNFDGLGRNDRLRYDSPEFFGATLSASITNGDALELAGRWAGEFQGLGKIAAAVGIVDAGDRNDPSFQQIGGSVSWLAPFGLNVTFAGGTREWNEDPRDGDDSINLYTKVGYKWSIHAVAVEFGQTNDLADEGDESRNVGAAYVITPWSGVDFYATVRTYELERDNEDNIEDIGQIMVGTRVKF